MALLPDGAIEKIRATIGFLRDRSRSYRLCFRSPAGADVLKDLAKFCRAHETAFHENDRVHAALEGRRDVWLRIMQHLNLSPDELYETFGGKYPLTRVDEEDEDV